MTTPFPKTTPVVPRPHQNKEKKKRKKLKSSPCFSSSMVIHKCQNSEMASRRGTTSVGGYEGQSMCVCVRERDHDE